jgi:large subunit ribosomal protein L22
LEISPRKAAKIFLKTLKSAMANAVNNNDIEERVLVVKSAYVGPGAILRRFRPKARGSAGRIRKRTAHFTVVVTSDVK